MSTCFYLARHGETLWNTQNKLQGSLDSPLTKLGVQQAHQLAQGLSSVAIDYIYCSPLGRALKTAEICQSYISANLETKQFLVERHFGDWQQRPLSEIQRQTDYQYLVNAVDNSAPCGGESGVACASRLKQGLLTLANRHSNQSLLIVCHGDLIRCFVHLYVDDAHSKVLENGQAIAVIYNSKNKAFSLSAVTSKNNTGATCSAV